MGNQAESFEDDDGGADHDILEDARPDATHDSNGHLAGQTNPDANGITPQHDSEEMEGGNPHLQALLPNGDKYEDEGGEADQPHTKPPPPLNENKNENKNGNETTSVGVGVAKKKKKTKSKPKSKRGLVKPNRNHAQGESDLMTYGEGSTDRLRRILRRCARDARRA